MTKVTQHVGHQLAPKIILVPVLTTGHSTAHGHLLPSSRPGRSCKPPLEFVLIPQSRAGQEAPTRRAAPANAQGGRGLRRVSQLRAPFVFSQFSVKTRPQTASSRPRLASARWHPAHTREIPKSPQSAKGKQGSSGQECAAQTGYCVRSSSTPRSRIP